MNCEPILPTITGFEVAKSQQRIAELDAEINRLGEQLAEAERIIGCARVALRLVVGWADFLHAKWDSDQDHKVGKGLLALAGRMPGYAPDTDGIHGFIAEVNGYKTGGEE